MGDLPMPSWGTFSSRSLWHQRGRQRLLPGVLPSPSASAHDQVFLLDFRLVPEAWRGVSVELGRQGLALESPVGLAQEGPGDVGGRGTDPGMGDVQSVLEMAQKRNPVVIRQI